MENPDWLKENDERPGVDQLSIMSTAVKASYYEKPTCCQIFMAIFFSPIGVAMRHGCSKEFGISLGLYIAYLSMIVAGFVFDPILFRLNIFGIIGLIYSVYVTVKRVDPPAGYYYA